MCCSCGDIIQCVEVDLISLPKWFTLEIFENDAQNNFGIKIRYICFSDKNDGCIDGFVHRTCVIISSYFYCIRILKYFEARLLGNLFK